MTLGNALKVKFGRIYLILPAEFHPGVKITLLFNTLDSCQNSTYVP